MKYLLVLSVLTAWLSCRKAAPNVPSVSSVPYFAFDEVGKNLLSEIKLNDTVRFTGSNGSSRKYIAHSITKTKDAVKECTGTTGACTLYYYIDHIAYFFSRLDSAGAFFGHPLFALDLYMRLPANTNLQSIPADIKAKAVISGGSFVDFNWLSVQSPGSFGLLNFPDFYQPLTTMNFSNSVRTYTEVIVIKSGNNTVVQGIPIGVTYTVSEVWFDKKYGIVFFKDVFGNSWSRIN